MTEKRTVDWIQITDPDNIEKIASPRYIVKLLGLQSLGSFIDSLYNRVNSLENNMRDLRKPERLNKVLRLLRSCQNTPHNYRWFEHRIIGLSWHETRELVTEGKLECFKSGNVDMYKLTEQGWKQE